MPHKNELIKKFLLKTNSEIYEEDKRDPSLVSWLLGYIEKASVGFFGNENLGDVQILFYIKS